MEVTLEGYLHNPKTCTNKCMMENLGITHSGKMVIYQDYLLNMITAVNQVNIAHQAGQMKRPLFLYFYTMVKNSEGGHEKSLPKTVCDPPLWVKSLVIIKYMYFSHPSYTTKNLYKEET